MTLRDNQEAVCKRFQSEFVAALDDQKVGIARATLGRLPINALRHPLEGDTSGWYIWCGEELSEAPDFFRPLHVAHLHEYVPELLPYLGLAPGWRVLLAPGYEDVWYDHKLLIRAL